MMIEECLRDACQEWNEYEWTTSRFLKVPVKSERKNRRLLSAVLSASRNKWMMIVYIFPKLVCPPV